MKRTVETQASLKVRPLASSFACVAALVLLSALGCDDGAGAQDGTEPPEPSRPAMRVGEPPEPSEPAMRVGEPLHASYTLLPLYAEAQSADMPVAIADAGDGAGVRVIDPIHECDDEAVADDCDDNTAPVLRDPLYVINGLLVPDLSDVRNGDQITVLVEFEDEQCNLACGSNSSSSETFTSAASAPSNIPCSTEESGMHLGLYVSLATVLGPNVSDKAPEGYRYQLRVSDRCGAPSEPVVVEFTVTF